MKSKITSNILFLKALFYRILATIIYACLFGIKTALLIAIVATIVYFIYDIVFYKIFKR